MQLLGCSGWLLGCNFAESWIFWVVVRLGCCYAGVKLFWLVVRV